MSSDPSPAELAAMIDHTFLKPDGAPEAIEQLCSEAVRYHFGAVMVHASEIARCRQLLAESAVRIGTVAGFPLGQNHAAGEKVDPARIFPTGPRPAQTRSLRPLPQGR